MWKVQALPLLYEMKEKIICLYGCILAHGGACLQMPNTGDSEVQECSPPDSKEMSGGSAPRPGQAK